MALTDINTVTGIYDFIKECKAVIKPLVGIEFRYNNKLLYIGLAKTAICGNERFLTQLTRQAKNSLM
jgi:DNA polymerase-3 subunit alpha/error-prone DNA polymerase